MDDSAAGALLVATPEMLDPNFARSVVFLLEHSEEGALGLNLSQPLDLDVSDVLPDWAEKVTVPRVAFVGGPVQREVAVGLALRSAVAESDNWQPVFAGIGVIDLSLEPRLVSGIEALRIFSGYSGWSAGQLEMELAIGSWLVVPPMSDDPFSPEPEGLWRRVLRRQGGSASWYADYPEDVRLN